jgi:TolB-like protein/tetratricopeptide (TPR) repeat protein
MSFFSELKRRNVYRVGALYVVVGWLLLQVTDVVTSVLDLPAWTGKLVAVLLFIGLPVVLIGAWAFELTPDGLVRDRAADGANKRAGKRHATDYIILAALLTALSWMAWQHDWGDEGPEPGESHSIRSLAVLPFKNLMNDDSQEYFVEGMHDALITELSRISALRVISRTSANRYRDADLPLPAIAEELGVDALVEGSVLRYENTVRINVQLIDATADRHIWGEQFDRNLGDIFSLYTEVTRRITEQIQVQVSDSEQAHLATAEPVDSQTYDQFLRSVDLCNRWAPQPMLRGIEQLRDLIGKEPDNARAHAALALCLQYAAFFDFVVNTEIREEALSAANRAVSLAPDLTMAQVAKGGTYWYLDFDAKTAMQALEHALKINPTDTSALIHHSWLMSESGRHNQALDSAKKAVRSDPFNNAAQQALGQAHYLARDFQASLEPLIESVNLDPGDPSFYVYPAWSYSQLNRHEEALSLLETAIDLSDGAPFHLAEYGMALAFAGRIAEAEVVLEQLETMKDSNTVSPFHFAQVNMALGNRGAALDGLEAAFEARDNGLFYIAYGAQFDSLRGEPRFEALVEKLKP